MSRATKFNDRFGSINPIYTEKLLEQRKRKYEKLPPKPVKIHEKSEQQLRREKLDLNNNGPVVIDYKEGSVPLNHHALKTKSEKIK